MRWSRTAVALVAASTLTWALGCSSDDDVKTKLDAGTVSDLITDVRSTVDTQVQTDEGVTKPDAKPVCKIATCPQPQGKVTCATLSQQVQAEQESPCLDWVDATCQKVRMITKPDSPTLPNTSMKFQRSECKRPDGAAL